MRDPIFSRFDTIPERLGTGKKTDRRGTDGHTTTAYIALA